MAGRTVDMGYLVHIELLKRNAFDESSAVTGRELFKTISSIPHSHRKKWAPWFGYDFIMITDWGRNVNDEESMDYLLKNAASEPDRLEIACDSYRDVENHDHKTAFTAKYWIFNFREKGQDFYCGIGETIERNLAMIGVHPLKGLTELSQIEDDYDCWDYIKTWLDNNWRGPDQITKKSLKEIEGEIFKGLNLDTKAQKTK